jgi:acyl-CoA thioester hydrolase
MEQFGVSYKSMEDDGVMLPVYEMNFKYKKPAHFDDILTIETILEEKPNVRIKFRYKIYRGNELLTMAKTTLVFMESDTKKPTNCPKHILKAIGY